MLTNHNGSCAAVFLFLDGSAVFVLRAMESVDIPSNVLSANFPCQCVFDLAARAAGGRHYVLCDTTEYLSC